MTSAPLTAKAVWQSFAPASYSRIDGKVRLWILKRAAALCGLRIMGTPSQGATALVLAVSPEAATLFLHAAALTLLASSQSRRTPSQPPIERPMPLVPLGRYTGVGE
jgi:hypothetical protein